MIAVEKSVVDLDREVKSPTGQKIKSPALDSKRLVPLRINKEETQNNQNYYSKQPTPVNNPMPAAMFYSPRSDGTFVTSVDRTKETNEFGISNNIRYQY